MKANSLFAKISIYSACSWVFVFALLPLSMMCLLSVVTHTKPGILYYHVTGMHYHQLFQLLYLRVLFRSLLLALTCVVGCLLVAYPLALVLSTLPLYAKNTLLLLAIIPMWTSSLVRCYAMMALLKAKGLFNTLLLALGLIHQPLQILFTNTAVIIGLTYNLMPFMLLPLYSNIERLDKCLFEAARDCGASRWQILTRVLLPLTMPGILAGSVMVFLPAMTLFYIPDLLGGAKSLLLGNLIKDQFLFVGNWSLGSAIGVMLSVLMIPLLMLCWRSQRTAMLESVE